jgi:hypothetical protein
VVARCTPRDGVAARRGREHLIGRLAHRLTGKTARGLDYLTLVPMNDRAGSPGPQKLLQLNAK